MLPNNLEEEGVPNPRWFEGNSWRLELSERGDHELLIRSEGYKEDPDRSVSIKLTGEQAAKLAAHALGGAFDPYGTGILGDSE